MILFFVILALVFVVLLVIITNIVIVPQSKVRHRAAGQLLRHLVCRPARQDPVH